MNRTWTSPDIVVSPRYNEGSFSSRLTHLKAPTPLDRGGISGDLTEFSSIYTALRAVKGTEEGNESHVDLTQHCGKSPVTTNTVLIAFNSPGSTHTAESM